MLSSYYVCHIALEEDEPILRYFMPPRPNAAERDRRRELLERARQRKVRDLQALAREYRLTLPLVMERLDERLRVSLLGLAHRNAEDGACRL